MTDDQDPERQRTVAELLQQYGGGRGGGSRRRRRVEDDDSEPGQPDGRPEITLGAVPEQRWTASYGRSIDPLTGEPVDPLTGRPLGRTEPPSVSPGSSMSPGSYAGDPVPTGPLPPAGTGVYRAFPSHPPDPPTEQLPAYPDSDRAGPVTGPITGPIPGFRRGLGGASGADAGGPPTGQVSRAELFDDEDDDPDGTATEDGRERGAAESPAPAGLTSVQQAEEAAEAGPPGVAGWALLVGQWLLGAVAGALLWVGFSYLWRNVPVVALVAAVLTTGALVLVVRAIRRSDDLQTTMLAVLVGLVVTISPAVLLLVAR